MRSMIFAVAAGSLLIGLAASSAIPQPPADPAAAPQSDSELIAALRKQIEGKEKEPAETVFKNIQILKGRPAASLLAVMDKGYRRSLGVRCSHCHDTQNFASDDKSEKRIAREMSNMVRDINEKYLKSIQGLKSERPVVNCTTCHRGQVKPAIDLEPAPAAGN
jgi:photosynthetic reaction center cytochrome c subunit